MVDDKVEICIDRGGTFCVSCSAGEATPSVMLTVAGRYCSE